jgi:hypothetical protein
MRKPTTIGWIKRKKSNGSLFGKGDVNRMEREPMSSVAGKTHTIKVKIERGRPPFLWAMRMRIWVEDAPGNKEQKVLRSSSSFSVRSFLLSTKIFNMESIWPCGPPNAVME